MWDQNFSTSFASPSRIRQQHQAVADRRQEMHVAGALALAAAQRLTVQGDAPQRLTVRSQAPQRGSGRTLGGRRLPGQVGQHTLGPPGQRHLQGLLVQPREDGVQSPHGGCLAAGEAQGTGQVTPVAPAPLGHRAVTLVATESGGTGQGEDGGQRVAQALRLAEVGHLGQRFDEWTARRFRQRFRHGRLPERRCPYFSKSGPRTE